jgi:transposase
MLSIEEQEEIVEEYEKKYIPQNEIAKRFRVTVQLVRDLVAESRK